MPYSSKGFEEAHAIAANRAIDRLFKWSDGGRLPVVVDASPCAFSLATCRAALDPVRRLRFDAMRIEDALSWAHDAMLPRLPLRRRVPPGVTPVPGREEGLSRS
jgi:D-lactate dehydrogenase